MTPAHRRKALAGRVIELAGGAKLGKGEKAVREAEKNKAAKRVREGLAQKQKEREKQQLEEVHCLLSHLNLHSQTYVVLGQEPGKLSPCFKEAL